MNGINKNSPKYVANHNNLYTMACCWHTGR